MLFACLVLLKIDQLSLNSITRVSLSLFCSKQGFQPAIRRQPAVLCPRSIRPISLVYSFPVDGGSCQLAIRISYGETVKHCVMDFAGRILTLKVSGTEPMASAEREPITGAWGGGLGGF